MLFRIGRQADLAADDVVGPLLACHERIERFCTMAEALVNWPNASNAAGSPDEIADAAAQVDRYFRIALPLHVDDEELSILPRLVASAPSGVVLEALETMKREHAVLEGQLESLLPRWAEIAESSSARARMAPDLGRDTSEIARLFRAHLANEEKLVFPSIRARIGTHGLAIRNEMRARRSA